MKRTNRKRMITVIVLALVLLAVPASAKYVQTGDVVWSAELDSAQLRGSIQKVFARVATGTGTPPTISGALMNILYNTDKLAVNQEYQCNLSIATYAGGSANDNWNRRMWASSIKLSTLSGANVIYLYGLSAIGGNVDHYTAWRIHPNSHNPGMYAYNPRLNSWVDFGYMTTNFVAVSGWINTLYPITADFYPVYATP